MSDTTDLSSTPSLKHELRTPLNHIIGYCEMLIEEAEDAAVPASGDLVAMVPDLQRIHGAGRRLLGVINDLFDRSIPEAERLNESHLHHEVRTPLNQIIGYTELLQEIGGQENGSYAEDLGKIHAAAFRLLDLVLVNFDAKEFTVADSERFDDGQVPTLLHRRGDGLKGGGARIPHTHAVGSILIADDDASNREMLARRLRRLGHAVKTAADGCETVEMIRGEEFDLLLLDVIMPRMNGYEVLDHLRINPPMAALPVIMLSASDDSESVARCIEMGAEDYLAKPFDPVLLQARIDSSLEKKRLRDREAAFLRTIQLERERSEDLLQVILPSNIVAELKSTGVVRPRRIENVAVLFSDVVGFTSYCEKRDPETIHRDLQALVKELEVLTSAHGMEKIKTIGDAFMAVSGLLLSSGNPALDCVRCGLGMARVAEELPTAWRLRVGVHLGPVVAGIVGRQKYQYDIWGDTVNAAARMEGEAEPGTVCVSAQVWAQVASQCVGRSLGFREIKGRGRSEVFVVEGLRE